MSDTNSIKFLTHKEIDKVKWDKCIDTAVNGLIYSYSFYLDQMAKNWDGLVLRDYEAVMPLTWNSKFGIRYIYQPFLTAQLGIFGKNVTEELVKEFIQSIPSSFKLIEVPLNSKNPAGISTKFCTHRNNYILNLQKSYTELYDAFNENTKRNIKKASEAGCITEKDFSVEKVIELAVAQMKNHARKSADNVTRFSKLFHLLQHKKMAATYGISLNNQLLTSCVFFFSHNRAYYILVGNHPDSRTTGASHALIDAFIKDYAGKNMLLDFEGSDIPGLASFYSSFGAINEQYPFLRINRLPFYLKWLKG